MLKKDKVNWRRKGEFYEGRFEDAVKEGVEENENFFDFCGVEWQWGLFFVTKTSPTGSL